MIDYLRAHDPYQHHVVIHTFPGQQDKVYTPLLGGQSQKNDNSKYCLARPGELYLVYLPKGGTTELDLTGVNRSLEVKWFNPRQGGALQGGSVRSVSGGRKVALGTPPTDGNEDWLAVIRK